MIEISSALLQVLRTATAVAVLTGAGISAESGVPTFREAQTGLWQRFRPEELATPQAFRNDPRLVWEWYAWRRSLVEKATPNPGHLALVEFENHYPVFTLITQNVDNLHQRAGSRKVIELHGNLQRTICAEEGIVIDTWEEVGEIPPRCRRCGGLLRPDVVWFGEALPAEQLSLALEAAQCCQVFFSIGTSGIVEPAAYLPYLAKQHGASLIEINPSITPLSPYADFYLPAASGQVLPQLAALLSS